LSAAKRITHPAALDGFRKAHPILHVGDFLEIPRAASKGRAAGINVPEKEKLRLDASVSDGTSPKVQAFSRVNPAPIKAWRPRLGHLPPHPTVPHEWRPTAIQHRRWMRPSSSIAMQPESSSGFPIGSSSSL
jgi:hypothetical protein